MTAHFPPFTKPVDAYDSARLYRETSEIAAAQDARLNGKPRDDLQSIMANLRADLHRAYENAKCRIDAIDRTQKLTELANEAQAWGMYPPTPEGVSAGCALPPNLAAAVHHPMHAEALRVHDERIAGPEDRL